MSPFAGRLTTVALAAILGRRLRGRAAGRRGEAVPFLHLYLRR